MPGPTANRSVATVIGDIVGSRGSSDRRTLHRQLKRMFNAVNDEVVAIQPLAPTVGDEFQAVYSDLSSALHATLRLRLLLIPDVDVRFGVGWGRIRILSLDRTPFEQDGPGWWAARDAIEHLTASEKRNEVPRGLRTLCFFAREKPAERLTPSLQVQLFPNSPLTADAVRKGINSAINSFLMCRDELVGGMDDRDAAILLRLFAGETQRQIAKHEKVTQSAISQRIQRSGAYAVLHGDRSLRTTPWPV